MLSSRELLNGIQTYVGDDPLEPYIHFVTYFEQNRLSGGKYGQKFKSVVLQAVRRFISDDNFKNDRRFVDLYIKSVRHSIITTNFISKLS
jgi:hypothetical protein